MALRWRRSSWWNARHNVHEDAVRTAQKARRFALLVEYDGTAYCGSQYQDNGPSIQQELESAREKLTGARSRVAFAGRTDAGVHALGQVAAFDVETRLGAGDLTGGLNHFLPRDIAVRETVDAPATFDPRRDARGRTYRYEIDNRQTRSPLERQRRWHVDRPLDIEPMARAARSLEGAHEFAAFAGPYEGLTKRTLRRCELTVRGAWITLTMEAEAFLPHQVRRTAGALVEVGLGRLDAGGFAAMLHAGTASQAGPAAPPHGLYLVGVRYDTALFAAHTDGCER